MEKRKRIYPGDRVKVTTPEHEIIYGTIVKVLDGEYWVFGDQSELWEGLKENDFELL